MYNKTAYGINTNGEFKMKFTVPEGDKDEYHSVIVSCEKKAMGRRRFRN